MWRMWGSFGTDEEFSFVAVKFEEVILHPECKCRQAGFDVGEGGVVGGFGAEVNLGVVGVAVEVHGEMAE